MHLIHVCGSKFARLKDVTAGEKPRYAVLSHRWTDDEVTFIDICRNDFRRNSSLDKFWGTLEQACKDGFEYAWIDTCCIDKQSSAELSEAINSMYQWYEGAERCYVYLADVERGNCRKPFRRSEWFTRGWTLQELLAPRNVVFYDCNWQILGDKFTLANDISSITGIALEVIQTRDLKSCSVAQKMAWAASRVTSRLEDRAYSLMGLFGVNMPLLYGEGERAFVRLQEEIIKFNDDRSIFAWSMGETAFTGLLAPSPDYFAESQHIVPSPSLEGSQPFFMTNRGLSVKLKVTPWFRDTYLAQLDCKRELDVFGRGENDVGILLRRCLEPDQYVRINSSQNQLTEGIGYIDPGASFQNGLCFGTGIYFRQARPREDRQLFVRQNLDLIQDRDHIADRTYGFGFKENCLPPSVRMTVPQISADKSVATLPPGGWGCTVVVELLAQSEGLYTFALGFDFDFNPVCLLWVSVPGGRALDTRLPDWDYLSSMMMDETNLQWDEIVEGRTGVRLNDDLWALRGHRLHGLDVLLSEPRLSIDSIVKVLHYQTSFPLLWRFEIDNWGLGLRDHSCTVSNTLILHVLSTPGKSSRRDRMIERPGAVPQLHSASYSATKSSSIKDNGNTA